MDDFQIDTPSSLRPDLTEFGIEEYDRGVCEDTYEYRRILRQNKLSWTQVYDINGETTNYIQVLSPEMSTARSLSTLEDRRFLLVDPRDPNSDYNTGMELLLTPEISRLVPTWVIAQTRTWRDREKKKGENPGKVYRSTYLNPPSRCQAIKADGIRCILWYSGRVDEQGLCRTHLLAKPDPERLAASLQRAKNRIVHSAPYAAEVLMDLMDNATSEPVRQKAASDLLDRAGIRGGIEVDTNVVVEFKPARDLIAERLDKLRKGIDATTAKLEEANMIEAEIVEDDDQS